jgi:hypothetical protein
MWGYTVRDSATIPSIVERRLAADGVGPVEIVNLAQPAYNATQGLVTLLLELRAGRVPAAVVSLDGNNEVLTAEQEGHAGAVVGEAAAARQSTVGWRGFWANVLGLARYSALGARLLRAVRPPRVDRTAVRDSALDCSQIAGYYRGIVRSAEGLGREFGFPVAYFWQPHWATTGKRLTRWEASLRGEGRFPGLMRHCSRAVDSAMADRAGRSYLSLTGLFDADTTSVFLDEFGHLTEAGTAKVADAIADRLEKMLSPGTELRTE